MKSIQDANSGVEEKACSLPAGPFTLIDPTRSQADETETTPPNNIAAFSGTGNGIEWLDESQAWVHALFEGVETGLFIIDPETHTLVNANSVAAEMVGVPREKIVGSQCHKFVCPAEKGRCPVTDLGQTVDNSERILLTAIGEKRSIIKTVRPVLVSGRTLLLESFLDITKLKRTEESLRESEDRFRTAFEDAPYGMCLTAPNGRFLHANAALCAMLGYSEQELLAGAWQQITHADDLERSKEATIELGRPGAGPAELEKRYIRKNGSIVWARLKISPASLISGTPHFITQIEDITLRKQADEAKAFLASLVESSQDAIIGATADGTIISWNRGARELFGYESEEIVGQHVSMLFPQGDVDESQDLREKASRGEQTLHYETVRVRKDGTHVRVELTLSPVHDTRGAITGVAAIAHDITVRKRAQEELLFKTTLLETVAETTIDGILVVDRAGRLLQSNRRFAEIFNIPQDLLSQRDEASLLNHVRPLIQDLAGFIERIQYLQAHESEEARDEVLFTDGRCIDRYSAPLKSVSGGYDGRVWYFRDITDRKRAEQALRENEERYRDLFENASEIIFTTDLNGRFTSMNLAGQQAFGYSQEEAAKTDIWRLVAPEYLQFIEDQRTAMLAGEAQLAAEIEVITKNGRRMRLEVKPRLISRGGQPEGVQAIARDITGRNAAEIELRQAQKLESVGRLASGIAHEINTPIQFIGDNTLFLQDSFASLRTVLGKLRELRDVASSAGVAPDLLKDLQRVEDESDCAYLLSEIPQAVAQTLEGVNRVATIVRAMKEFAHPENKEMAPADLNQALQSTMTVARNEWKYVADVETDFADLPSVTCIVGDLNQVFLNLLVNAAHAIADVVTDGSKGKISIRTALEADKVHISISDTGSGIPEDIRQKIFDPFFTTKEVGRGTGQGLAIARSVVVDRHKGTLTFESEVGKGTTFHIRLPLAPPDCLTDRSPDVSLPR